MNAFRHRALAVVWLLVLGLHADAQKSAAFRSATHPFFSPRKDPNDPDNLMERLFGSPLALAANTYDAAWYSAGVNNVLCSLLLPGQTWLGTAFGVKRLDLQTCTVQHFTALDGLPYNRIAALASSGGTLLCASVRQQPGLDPRPSDRFTDRINEREPHTDTVALCRFDPATARWSVLAEEKRFITREMLLPPEVDTKAMPQQWVATTKLFACLIPGVGLPGQSIALRYRLSDGKIERISAPDGLNAPFVVTTAQMDDANLWLGSDRGLLHFDFQTRRWETLLADTAIYGGVRAEDGSLWILAKASDPYTQDMERGRVHSVRWMAVHLQSGQPQHLYPIYNRNEAELEFAPGHLENITLANGRVWTTVYQVRGSNAEWVYLPTVFSLDPQTGEVTRVDLDKPNSRGAFDAIPDSVLANSHTGSGQLTPREAPALFPGWICGTDPSEEALLTVPGKWWNQWGQEARGWDVVDGSGPGWSGRYLMRYAIRPLNGAPQERYTLAPARFTVHDTAIYPVPIGEKVYFLTDRTFHSGITWTEIRLCAWNRRTGTIETIPTATAALKQYRAQLLQYCTLLPGNGCLWIGTGNRILRYDLSSGNVGMWEGNAQAASGYATPYVLLSVEGGDTAWVRGMPNRLYTAKLGPSHELTPVTLPALPGDLERNRDKMILLTVEDHIAWFTGASTIGMNERPVVGYDLSTRQWTQPYDASFPLTSVSGAISTVKQGSVRWFPADSRRASAYGYDTVTGQWTTLPPVTVGTNHFQDRLVAVDAQSAWLSAGDLLYHLDRKRGVWNQEALPFNFSGFEDGGSARVGTNLVLGTPTGVWIYDTSTRKLTHSPGVPLTSSEMLYRVMAVDRKAVWLDVSRGETHAVARFDRTTHAWRNWSADDGVPQRYGTTFTRDYRSLSGMTADNRTCWLLANGTLCHLNPKTGHWDNVSHQLAGHGAEVRFQQVVADGEAVWLVPLRENSAQQNPATWAGAPLYRYRAGHADSEQLTPIYPAPGKILTPETVSAIGKAVFLSAREGVYWLDRSSGKWKPVMPPALPAGFPALVPVVTREERANIWVIGDDSALRFQKAALY